MESDVFITADRIPVLDHDGMVGGRIRRRAIRAVNRADLPAHIPSLAEYFERIGTDLELSLDVKDPDAFDATVEVARAAGAESSLWLCHPDIERLIPWRHQTSAKLVNSVRLSRISEGMEMRAAKLAEVGIDALNMRVSDWNAGHVATLHKFDRYALGWDAQQHREIATLIDIGIDGVFSDHVERMTETFGQFF